MHAVSLHSHILITCTKGLANELPGKCNLDRVCCGKTKVETNIALPVQSAFSPKMEPTNAKNKGQGRFLVSRHPVMFQNASQNAHRGADTDRLVQVQLIALLLLLLRERLRANSCIA